MNAKQTAITTTLIAAILASIGGASFLKKHPDPTLREVFVACETGELTGLACCEDMRLVTDPRKIIEQCGAVTPQNHDPLGLRKQEEDQWDEVNTKQKADK